MAETYGYAADGGRVVFDPQLLEQGAAQLREQFNSRELVGQLKLAMAPPSAFGLGIPGANEAWQRLQDFLDSVQMEMERVGLDMADLASRALAASKLASQADPATRAAAERGGR